MDLVEQLLLEHSKENTRHISDYIIKNPERFDELMTLFFTAEYRVTQRAAWVVGTMADEKPDMFEPYIAKMLEYCRADVHDAVPRNIMRILQFVDIPEELSGIAYDTALELLSDPKSPVAVKCFSMSVAANVAKDIPELQSELLEVIDIQLPYQSKGYQARARHVAKLFRKSASGK